MRSRLDLLESGKKADRQYIHQLEERVDNLERMLCSKKLEIKNVPLTFKETKNDLSLIVLNTANVIGAPLQRSEIQDVYCMRKKDKPSKIIVELSGSSTKDNIIKRARQFNTDNKQNKLSSTHLNMNCPATPIYVSDFLPPQTQHLFYLARKFAKENGYLYCWVSAGRVFLRKNEPDKPVIVKCESDLDTLLPGI